MYKLTVIDAEDLNMMKIRHYSSEYDRFIGELSQTNNVPYSVRHNVEQRLDDY